MSKMNSKHKLTLINYATSSSSFVHQINENGTVKTDNTCALLCPFRLLVNKPSDNSNFEPIFDMR